MGRREIALAGGSIDADLPRVLNGASDGVQSAADRALQVTDPAMSFAGASDVLVEVRPGLAVRPERLLAGGIVQPHAVPGAKYGQRQSGQPHEKHQLSGRPGQSTAGHVRFTLAGWRKSQQPAHGQLPPLAPRAVRVWSAAALADNYLRSRATVQLFGPVGAAVVPIMRSPSTRAVYEVPPAENAIWSPRRPPLSIVVVAPEAVTVPNTF